MEKQFKTFGETGEREREREWEVEGNQEKMIWDSKNVCFDI
jgi:hypothetical protein